MSSQEINDYINTGDCYDKAGGYGIQSNFAIYVKEISGDYNNVVGLPISKLYHELQKLQKLSTLEDISFRRLLLLEDINFRELLILGYIVLSEKYYLCIDLKSFYASVECIELGLDPMTTNLVVADKERTDKTICLAITPAMKALGIKNRCRLFEIPKNVEYITAVPRMKRYIDYSADIYSIYLKYISKDDIHVYSIDEAFMDVTNYLALYQMDELHLGVQ